MQPKREAPNGTYVRLGADRPCLSWSGADGGQFSQELLFIDIDEGSDLLDLRRLPREMIRGCRTWLLRAGELSPERIETLDRLISELNFKVREIYRLEHPLGDDPRIVQVDLPGVPDVPAPDDVRAGALWRLAREVELRALLAWGGAVWNPPDHHFILPGGQHISAFINIGNAIRCRRDAVVLATWLMRRASRQCALIIDTRTLLSVGLALDRLISDADPTARLRSLELVEDFPRNTVDILAKVIRAQRWESEQLVHDTRLIALITVNFTGHLRDHLFRAFKTVASEDDTWSIDVLVDQGVAFLGPVQGALKGLETWSHGVIEQQTSPDCALCRDPKRAPAVLIEPGTFQIRFRSHLDPRMPDLQTPRKSYRLFEALDRTKAVALASQDGSATHRTRPMPVKVQFERLLDRGCVPEDFLEKLVDAIRKWAQSGQGTVMVSANEAKRTHFREFWAHVTESVKETMKLLDYPLERWSEEICDGVRSARRILVFALTAITGHSLYRALEGIQSIRRDHDYEVSGLVVHARPPTVRGWKTLENAFSSKLEAIWWTPMPESSCPLQAEGEVYRGTTWGPLTVAEAELLEDRLEVCAGRGGDSPLFLGSNSDARISAHSIYGDRLGAKAIYAAVGAAVHTRRSRDGSRGPERPVFEMCAIARSYYDPLIFVSMLRWITPSEAWWGDQPDREARAALEDLLSRARPNNHETVLLPELLLACILGKVPVGPALQFLMAEADSRRKNSPAIGLMFAVLQAWGMAPD